MHSPNHDLEGLSTANSTKLALDFNDDSTEELPSKEMPTSGLPLGSSDSSIDEFPSKETPTSKLSQEPVDNSAYGFPITKAPHKCQELGENGGSIPMKAPTSSIPNGGFNAWLQVAGSFMLFFNSW
jgi:hypothetical protein